MAAFLHGEAQLQHIELAFDSARSDRARMVVARTSTTFAVHASIVLRAGAPSGHVGVSGIEVFGRITGTPAIAVVVLVVPAPLLAVTVGAGVVVLGCTHRLRRRARPGTFRGQALARGCARLTAGRGIGLGGRCTIKAICRHCTRLTIGCGIRMRWRGTIYAICGRWPVSRRRAIDCHCAANLKRQWGCYSKGKGQLHNCLN
jgi:hypothetical protein